MKRLVIHINYTNLSAIAYLGASNNCLIDLAPVIDDNDTEIHALNSRENNTLLQVPK